VTELFDGKVGGSYKQEEYKDIYKKGKDRYDAQIPPGYMDKSKKPDDTDQYGDLVLWLQLLDHAKVEQRPIILVTDDGKEDWWREIRGEKLGPRPELVDEFMAATGGEKWFYMYSTEQFLKYAKEYLNAEVKPEVIKEAERIKQQDADQLAWLRRRPFPVIEEGYDPSYYHQRRTFPWGPTPAHQAVHQDEVLAFQIPQAIISHGSQPQPAPPRPVVVRPPDEGAASEIHPTLPTHGPPPKPPTEPNPKQPDGPETP
jgi:hypothetical protein